MYTIRVDSESGTETRKKESQSAASDYLGYILSAYTRPNIVLYLDGDIVAEWVEGERTK